MIPCGPRASAYAKLDVCVPAALPLHMRARIREIRAVRVDPDHRGEGHARALLQSVCTAADLSDTWLMLLVEPEEGTDRQRLINFYISMGFLPIQAEPCLMIRQSLQARAAA